MASGLKGLQGIAGTIGKGLGVAVAAGAATAAIGLKSVIQLGTEYQGKLNELQAVTNSTGVQMAAVGAKAKALGSDLSLPATSAAGAAAAMLELAKGGLSVDAAMKAAKGTLQLAAAAQIDAAAAAEIQSNALNQFGLSADNAGKVADVLANTANAASGSIGDIALALKYVGPVAKSVGVSIGDTATAIGLLANKGIQADNAGTALRAMLAGLAAPSKPAAKALKQLGIDAFDSSGKFIGFRAVIDQLNKAQGRMTQEQFASAAATAFGREPLAAIVALAESGAPAFDEMATAVNRQGGAADVAAAKMKGLGGAWEGFKSQLETTGIEIFESIDGPLESIVRRGSQFVSDFTPKIKKGLDGAIAAGQLFGPELARSIESRASALGDVASKLLRPLVQGVKETLANGLEIGIRSVRDFADVVHKGVDAVEPLAKGVGKVVESFNRADGPIGAFGAALGIAYDIIKGVIGIVSPVIKLVASLVEGFSDLPGPVQAAAVALLALKAGPSILGGLRGALSGAGKDADDAAKKTGLFSRAVGLVAAPVKLVASGLTATANTFRQFNAEATAQQAIAQRSSAFLSLQADGFRSAQGDADRYGQSIGKLGGYNAAFNTSTIPAVAALRNFRDQTVAIREGAAAAGEPISRMGAAVGTLVERSPALSAMRDAFHGAADGAGVFGKAAGIASAAGSGLKSAAGGLVNALGGPFGIAIAGVSIGLGLLAGSQERAAQKTKEHQDRVSALASALRDSNGAIDDSVRSSAAKALQDTKVFETGKDVLQVARELGIQQNLLTDSYLGNAQAQAEVNRQLDAMIAAGTSVIDTESGKQQVMDLSAQSASNLKEQVGDTNKAYADAVQKNKDFEDAIKRGDASMLDATESGRDFAAAMRTLEDRTAGANDKARALKDALDALSGGQISLEASQARVNEQFDRLGEVFTTNGTAAEIAALKAKGFGNELLTSAGRISTTTENGRKLRDSLDDITASTVEVAQRTLDMTGSLDEAKKVVQENRDRFIAMADKMGIGATQAGILADQMGLVPDVVADILTPGMTDAQKEIRFLTALIDSTPGKKDVVVKTLSDEAERLLRQFGFHVEDLKDGQVKINLEDEAARREMDNFVNQRRTATVTVTPIIQFSKAKAQAILQDAFGGAMGGIVKPFATGGFQTLKPLKGGVASVIGPNTWRVIGDRMKDNEAFIPINRSSRSIAILEQTASQMGFALLRRFASGGVSVTNGTQAVPTVPASIGGDTFNIFEQHDPVSTALDVQRRQSFKARLR